MMTEKRTAHSVSPLTPHIFTTNFASDNVITKGTAGLSGKCESSEYTRNHKKVQFLLLL